MQLPITDSEISSIIESEKKRQDSTICLIASENYASRAVLEAQGSVMTNKYAEGYPGRRYYSGCEHYDEAEQLAIDRLKELFQCGYANVQPHSGSQANQAVYLAALKPGDRILSMGLTHGGHLSHGSKVNVSGMLYDVSHYSVDRATETIDNEEVRRLAKECRPRLIVCGYSAYPRQIDFASFKAIADEVNAYLMADIAHIAGLVAAGLHPSPIPYADFTTTTTHKTLRGPRGGAIMTNNKELAVMIDKAVFPGLQGGPLMHQIAAKAVSFKEALQPGFKEYQQQVVRNAQVLAESLKQHGFRLVSGGTDTHLMLVDLSDKGVTGRYAEGLLEECGISVNKNTIPYDTKPPSTASGIRIGTPAVTTRGMKEKEMEEIAWFIYFIIKQSNTNNTSMKEAIRKKISTLCEVFPI